MNKVPVERIFNVAALVRHPKNAFIVRLVLSKQQLWIVLTIKIKVAQVPVRCRDRSNIRALKCAQPRLRNVTGPRPCVSEPKRRQDMDQGWLAPTVVYGNFN